MAVGLVLVAMGLAMGLVAGLAAVVCAAVVCAATASSSASSPAPAGGSMLPAAVAGLGRPVGDCRGTWLLAMASARDMGVLAGGEGAATAGTTTWSGGVMGDPPVRLWAEGGADMILRWG